MDDQQKPSLYEKANSKFKENKTYSFKEAIQEGNFLIQPLTQNKKFIGITNMFREDDVEKTKEGEIFYKSGLKFHISLPEWDSNLYQKGCDIIVDTLMAYGVDSKFIKSGYKMSDDPQQAGKDVTAYARYSPEKSIVEWNEVLNSITQKLVDAKIPPGYRVSGSMGKNEKIIEGSNYITYRYEKKQPKIDPGTEFKVTVGGQPAYREYEQSSTTVNIGMSK